MVHHDDGDLAGFGERVRTARLRLEIGQEQLAAQVGTDAGNVSRWERGKGYPQAQQLARLAQALGESIDHLVLGVPSEHGQTEWPRALVEFLKTRSGELAQERRLVPTLLSVRLPAGGEPSVAFYRALVAALITADDER